MKPSKNSYKKKLGVAIAGLGFGEKVHIPALRSINEIELVSLWHPNHERLLKACDDNNIKGYSNWEELLNDNSIDAIIIATPPEPRYNLAIEALNADKHLLLEKPVCLNSNQIKELQRIAIKKHLSVGVDFEYRAVPLFMQTKRIIESQFIGEPWLIKLDWIMSSRANTSREWNWYSNFEKGGGVIGALGTHAFDILHWLFGPCSEINGLISTSINYRECKKSRKKKKVTSEDICLAHMKTKNSTNKTDIPIQVSLSSVSRNGRGFWIEIYGSKGSLLLGSDNQKDYVHGFGLWLTDSDGNQKSIQPDNDLIFEKTWTDGRIAPVSRIQKWWYESISSGYPMIPGLAEGAESQKICDQIKNLI